MMHKAWSRIEEVLYCFCKVIHQISRLHGSKNRRIFKVHPSNIKVTKGWNINDLNWIWVRLLSLSQLSNPSDLPCFSKSGCLTIMINTRFPKVGLGLMLKLVYYRHIWGTPQFIKYPTMHHFVTKMCTCTLMLQNGAMWDIWLMHCGICEIGLLRPYHNHCNEDTVVCYFNQILSTCMGIK